MKKSTLQVLFIGNHALKTLADIPFETTKEYSIKTISYERGSKLLKEIPKLVFNNICCDYNGEYEIENLSIALNFSLENFTNLDSNTILIGDPFELLYQAAIYGWLKENPNNLKNKSNKIEFNNLTVILLYPATMEFENMRKEISQLIYTLKKHKVNTFLIENHFNQASAIDNLLYYYDSESMSQLEHKVRGVKQILGHVTVL